MQEKKLNRDDLLHYKDNQHEVTSLIPGINNLQSTGAAPLKRAKAREAEGPGKLKLSMSMGNLDPLQINDSDSHANFMSPQNGMSSQQMAYLKNISSDANIENHPLKEKIYSKRFIVD